MALTIELPIEMETRLKQQAQERGVSLSVYISEILAVTTSSALPAPKNLSAEEFEAALDRLARHSDRIPSLPLEAFSREHLYTEQG
jgi:hypothetical protein